MSAPTPLVRAAVRRRDGDRCASCDTTSSLEFQHRRAVGMGGSKVRPGAADGLTLCTVCNAECERSLQTVALAYGWKARKWTNPLDVPVYFPHLWQWFRLEGQDRFEITAIVALDMMHGVYGDEYLRWFAEVKS